MSLDKNWEKLPQNFTLPWDEKPLPPLDNTLMTPPSIEFTKWEENWENWENNDYIVAMWIIESTKKIGVLKNKISNLQLMARNKREILSESDKGKIREKVKEVFISEKREKTDDAISKMVMFFIDERRKNFDSVINQLTSLVYECTDIEDLPKGSSFHSEGLKNMQERIEQVEKILNQLSVEVLDN